MKDSPEQPTRDLAQSSSTEVTWPVALDSMREGLQVLSREFRYLYVNSAAAEQGRRQVHDLVGRTMQELYPGVERTAMFQQLARCMRDSVPHRMENEFTYPDGNKGWFELRIQPVPEGLIVLSIDVTERHKLEEQLMHAQKLEAIGRLASGIAHDFNNMLTVVSSYAQLLRDALVDNVQVSGDLAQILAATERAAHLTRQLLALGRRQVLRPQLVAVNDAVAALAPMLSRLVGETVQVSLALGKPVGAIRVDPGQLDQVLFNLAANARDAMPEGGTLTIRTQDVLLDEGLSAALPDVVAGTYVMVTVSDTGCGMDAETQTRVFEPFFTTKNAGMGLGLATSHGIVRQSGGHMWVHSEIGHGSTFKLYFPHALVEGARQPAPERVAKDANGAETVLVVDDDAAVRRLCARVLSARGYTVLEADGAVEALKFAERYSGVIHVLLSDVVMPEQSGPQVYRALAALRPGLRVLFMCGYADHRANDELAGHPFLAKPFTPAQLTDSLRGALDGRPVQLDIE